MTEEIILNSPNKDFESIRKIDENGVEYWSARELMPLLGYETWRKFSEAIERAKESCQASSQDIHNHFAGAGKMIKIATGTPKETLREVEDYKLDRYACYLIAQNGDPRKREIALAQTYFAIQTRKQEIFQQLSEADKRLFIRGEVSEQNKRLFSTAKRAGVSNFGSFNDAGYQGLYGMRLSQVERKKDVKKGELLDRAGTTELAANLFRITQTEEKIVNEDIRGDFSASKAHFMVGGKVRQTIKDIGGTLPENLPMEKHIKELKRGKKIISK